MRCGKMRVAYAKYDAYYLRFRQRPPLMPLLHARSQADRRLEERLGIVHELRMREAVTEAQTANLSAELARTRAARDASARSCERLTAELLTMRATLTSPAFPPGSLLGGAYASAGLVELRSRSPFRTSAKPA